MGKKLEYVKENCFYRYVEIFNGFKFKFQILKKSCAPISRYR